MKVLRILFFCAVVWLLASCTSTLPPLISWARFSPPEAQMFQLNTNSAAVYGRFAIGPDFAFGNRLALQLRNETTKRDYLILFRETDCVYVVAVEPGRYRLSGFIATFVDHRTAGRRKFSNPPGFEILPNSLVYLGDFSGFADIEVIGQTWGIRGITNNLSATTEELRHKYPMLKSAPVSSVFDQRPN